MRQLLQSFPLQFSIAENLSNGIGTQKTDHFNSLCVVNIGNYFFLFEQVDIKVGRLIKIVAILQIFQNILNVRIFYWKSLTKEFVTTVLANL